MRWSNGHCPPISANVAGRALRQRMPMRRFLVVDQELTIHAGTWIKRRFNDRSGPTSAAPAPLGGSDGAPNSPLGLVMRVQRGPVRPCRGSIDTRLLQRSAEP